MIYKKLLATTIMSFIGRNIFPFFNCGNIINYYYTVWALWLLCVVSQVLLNLTNDIKITDGVNYTSLLTSNSCSSLVLLRLLRLQNHSYCSCYRTFLRE